jgi:hypothetical protein
MDTTQAHRAALTRATMQQFGRIREHTSQLGKTALWKVAFASCNTMKVIQWMISRSSPGIWLACFTQHLVIGFKSV